MKKIAIYTRISTSTKNQDLKTQLLPLREFCKTRDWEIYKEYSDVESGAKEERKGLKQLKRDAFMGRFNVVLVFRFDRFARSTKQLVSSLEDFNSQNIDFVSYSEQIDTTTPAGKALFTMISAFSEFERSIIQERVKAGIAKSKAKGVIWGRPKADKFKLEDEILHNVKQGMSINETAKCLGVSATHVKSVKKKHRDSLDKFKLSASLKHT